MGIFLQATVHQSFDSQQGLIDGLDSLPVQSSGNRLWTEMIQHEFSNGISSIVLGCGTTDQMEIFKTIESTVYVYSLASFSSKYLFHHLLL